jgi:ketosteroid isomerase-like protein
LWDWPCGHQPRPPESKDSRSASNAPRQQTQRRTGFLRGQFFVSGVAYAARGMARALASEAIEAVGCGSRRLSRENVDVVRRSFQAFNARDVNELVSLSTPDCEWLPFRSAARRERLSRTRRHPAVCQRRGRRLGGLPNRTCRVSPARHRVAVVGQVRAVGRGKPTNRHRRARRRRPRTDSQTRRMVTGGGPDP